MAIFGGVLGLLITGTPVSACRPAIGFIALFGIRREWTASINPVAIQSADIDEGMERIQGRDPPPANFSSGPC